MAELSRVERELVSAVQGGRRLDLAGPEPVEHAAMAGWEADREVRADVVRDILLGRADGPADPRGLRLRGARIVGRLDLDGLRTDLWFSLHDCDVVEPIRLRGAELPLLDLNGCRIAGLDAENVRVGTVVLLRDGFASAGQISLIGGRIGGKLDLYGSRLNSDTDTALAATGLQVSGSAYLNGGMVITGHGRYGAVRLVGVRVGGMLSMSGARVHNPAGPALTADNLQVQDMVSMSHGLQADGAGSDGTIRLVGARIAGALTVSDAVLRNDSGPALVAHYLEVGGTVYLDGVQATGLVRIAGGRVGRLVGTRVTFHNGSGAALDGTRLHAVQGVDLRGATLTGADDALGALHLRGARIGGDLDLRDARVDNPGGASALRLSQATIEGEAMTNTLVVGRGDIIMRGATLGGLRDDPARLPAGTRLGLDGLTYRGIPGARQVTTEPAELRVAWLRRMESYAAQPYRQLAAAYQAAGHEDDARRILIAQQRHLLDSGLLGGWSRLRNRLVGVTLGYGYESWRAVVGLLTTLLVAAVLLVAVGGATARVPPGGGPPPPGSAQRCAVAERLGLAVDETVPLIDTGTRDRCDLLTSTGPGQAVALGTLVLRLLGWGFATLVVAGYTGLVRRS